MYILIRKRKEQTLANYNRYSTQEHRVPSSQNTDQPVRREAVRRQGPTAAHRLTASPGRCKPQVSLEEMRTLPTRLLLQLKTNWFCFP